MERDVISVVRPYERHGLAVALTSNNSFTTTAPLYSRFTLACKTRDSIK